MSDILAFMMMRFSDIIYSLHWVLFIYGVASILLGIIFSHDRSSKLNYWFIFVGALIIGFVIGLVVADVYWGWVHQFPVPESTNVSMVGDLM